MKSKISPKQQASVSKPSKQQDESEPIEPHEIAGQMTESQRKEFARWLVEKSGRQLGE